MNLGHFPRLRKIWRSEVAKAEKAFPGIAKGVDLRVRSDAGMSGRAFGYYDPATGEISVSPRLEIEPLHRARAIIRHELGHAVSHRFDPLSKEDSGEEAKADSIAGKIGAQPIRYDRYDVQTIGPGSLVRPDYLHR